VIPLPVILIEFIAAIGLAMVVAYGLALVRLRREGPPAGAARTPSQGRLVALVVVGFVATTWAVATFVAEGYNL